MTGRPISSDCLTTHHASKTSGRRDIDAIRWIVWHDTEGGTAQSIARWFASDAAQGSAHLVVDDVACYRCLRNDEIPWGAPGANTKGFHIETCGFARWTKDEWLRRIPTLQRLAYKTAFHCHKFDLPVRFQTASGLKAGRKGITTHAECSRAFGGDHSDPGRGFPRDFVVGLVAKYHAELAGKV